MVTTTAAATIPALELRHRLALALDHAGMTRDEMAGALGVSGSTVRNYLKDRTHPTRATLIAWSLRTGVDYWWLATGEEGGGPPDLRIAGRQRYRRRRGHRADGLRGPDVDTGHGPNGRTGKAGRCRAPREALASAAMRLLLAAALMALATLTACGGSDDNSGELWAAYLDVTGFTEGNAPADRAEVAKVADDVCGPDTDSFQWDAYLSMLDRGGLELAAALAEVECPDRAAILRVLSR